MTPAEQAIAARQASRLLAATPWRVRSDALHRIAAALADRRDEILAANARDLAEAHGLPLALAKRLGLTPAKLDTLADGVRTLADGPDPVGRVLRRTELADGLVLREETAPLGVLLVIFESRPDALVQIASLALCAGNGLLVKGGVEAVLSNRALHGVIVDALAPDVPAAAVGLVETRAQVADLLALHDVVDLVIPRGSSALVRHIQGNTRIPVLGHAEGICHVYVHPAADADMARDIVVDSKVDYPAACNAMETLLLDADSPLGPGLLAALRDRGVALYGDPTAAERFGLPPVADLHHEYGDMAATVAVVRGVDEAIAHIHRYGSAHTDAIVTGDPDAAARFLAGVDSACVFHNASTRFADGYRFGLGAEVGISTGRIHARGPVGVDGLLTTRWKLVGQGDTVAPFSAGERAFTHRRID